MCVTTPSMIDKSHLSAWSWKRTPLHLANRAACLLFNKSLKEDTMFSQHDILFSLEWLFWSCVISEEIKPYDLQELSAMKWCPNFVTVLCGSSDDVHDLFSNCMSNCFACLTVTQTTGSFIFLTLSCNCGNRMLQHGHGKWASPTHAEQQRVTDLQQTIGIVSDVSALKTKGMFFVVFPRSASSWTSGRQTLNLLQSVAPRFVGLDFLSFVDLSVLGVVCFAHFSCWIGFVSTCTMHFVLLIGFWLF